MLKACRCDVDQFEAVVAVGFFMNFFEA